MANANLFSKLEYSFNTNVVIEFSESTVRTLSFMPRFLDDWQYEAIANNDLDGYTYNPMANVMNLVINAAQAIYNNCFHTFPADSLANAYINLSNVALLMNTMIYYSGPDPTENLAGARSDTSNSINRLIEHTNRISGVIPIDANTADLPHYDTAMPLGKSLVYIMYQSDGITNSAPIIGSFTSLFILDTIRVAANTMWNISANIANSASSAIYDPNTLQVIGYNKDMDANVILKIETDLQNLNSNTFIERRVHDENFFKNGQEIMQAFNKMTRYKDPGQTELNLLKNYIGTEKLKSKNPIFK